MGREIGGTANPRSTEYVSKTETVFPPGNADSASQWQSHLAVLLYFMYALSRIFALTTTVTRVLGNALNENRVGVGRQTFQ